jgi:ribonuclease BN (tRNA processing enzyme)
MAQEQLDWPNLNAIWISHFHLDHSVGLFPFLFGVKWSEPTQHRRHPLTIYGPAGVEKFFWSFHGAQDYELEKQPFPLEIREVTPFQDFEIFPGVRAITFKTPHTGESLALKIIDSNGASLVFTADTGYTDALAEFARGVDLFLMECTFWRDKPVDIHLELTEAMKLAQLSGARRVLLSHLDPVWDNVDLAAEAKKLWEGETIEAKDGLRLDIGRAQARPAG